MKVVKRYRRGYWNGEGSIDFYITDGDFDRVVKVTFNWKSKDLYLTVVKSHTSKHLEESSPLELLLLTGLDRSDLERILSRTPR